MEKGARRQCTTVGSPRLRVAPRLRLGGSRRRSHEGASPLKLPQGSGVGGRHPPARGSQKAPRRQSPNLPSLRHRQGKGRWSRASIDPCSSLVYPIARRVNSAIRERGLRRSAARNYSAPVVTHCCIDPPTRTERTSFALRLRLRRRSRAAARPSAHARTRAPSAYFRAQAC
mgnify:CR=1 FL=1|jgi:hypothetical protein